jgi:hypothetical protein
VLFEGGSVVVFVGIVEDIGFYKPDSMNRAQYIRLPRYLHDPVAVIDNSAFINLVGSKCIRNGKKV